ncbi:MAG TPA: polyprenyl synthetase family protein, partial [Hellea balneolensis]|nr:polyprenyl synthetase family protein [Hellea balneolensis]
RMQSPVGMIPDLAEHLVGAGGKRLRPLLTIASAHLCDYQGTNHHKLAAAVEFIHSATLLHDDVVDDSDKRRGKTTANLIWGNAPSILVGDFLFARSFNLMVEAGSLEALGVLSEASSIIAEGEVQQLASLRDVEMSEDTYISVIGAKTAALFAAATEVSAVLAKRPQAERTALKTYGQELGIAFQLVDDMLDYNGNSTRLGKAVGDDFREGKMTLPVIHAYQSAKAAGRQTEIDFWNRVISKHEQNEVDLDTALRLLDKYGSLEATLSAANTHVAAAQNALQIFACSEWKTALTRLADFVTQRLY